MAEKLTRRGGKKNRKFGRNEKFCQKYRLEGRREKNRTRRLKTRLRRNPDDIGAARALKLAIEDR